MKYDKTVFVMVFGVACMLTVSCTSVRVIPEDLKEHVNRDLSFSQVLEAPLKHKGEILVFGGQVLSAKRLKHATQIEVLQLPLNRSMKPDASLQESQGRFLALQEEFLDPATLPFGTRVTVVGEVSGMVTLPLDQATYDFPTLLIKRLTVWPATSTYRVIPPRPYPYPYWGPYWGPYWWW